MSASPSVGEQAQTQAILEQHSSSWSQQEKLTAQDGDSNDGFGGSVAVSSDGTTALIGASDDDTPNGENAGSAYVSAKSGGSWSQQQKLIAQDGDSNDTFGRSVGVSSDGTTALVGSFNQPPNVDGIGSAYVFTESRGSWNQQEKLTGQDDSIIAFGSSVGVSGDGTTALIGAPADTDPNGPGAGSAYVFTESGNSWSQQEKLIAQDGDSNDFFGESVGVSSDGTTALIGAFQDDNQNGESAGSVYAFRKSGGSWSQQQKLTAKDGDGFAGFGVSVTVSGDGTTALIGANEDDTPNGDRAGSAYVFTKSGGSWSQQQKLTAADSDTDISFGDSVGVSNDGTTALIGASRDPDGDSAGSAYVFTESGNSWSQQQKLIAQDGDSQNRFGESVGVSSDGTTALIGAFQDDTQDSESAGSAYVFVDGNGESTNTPPTASFTVTPSSPTTGETVTFDGSSSTDPDGSIQRYEWDFNADGSYEQTGRIVSNSFSNSGDQTVTLRVTDDSGATATTSQTVSVTEQGSSLPSNLKRFDTNGQPGIQPDEIVDAIVANNSDTQIGGQPVQTRDIVELIVEYNS